MMNQADYLERIHIASNLTPTAGLLAELHYSHLKYILYENFDIINQKTFSLNKNDLFRKIITEKRGGYCYELNILFLWLLRQLGYKADLLSARIFQPPDFALGPEFDHPLIMVHLEEMWLVDVGNSKWFFEPLKIETGKYQTQLGASFRIFSENGTYFLTQTFENNKEVKQYQFTLKQRKPSDFYVICNYKWTSPDSKFTKGYICSKMTENGRVILNYPKFIRYENGIKTESAIESPDEFRKLIVHFFGVDQLEHISPDYFH